jgi:hypothetical protein
MFIHLKQDLDVVPIDWIGCEEPPETSNQVHEALTEYGVRKEVQELLASVRTDLDSFSDVEAFALMTSGYRMTEHYLPNCEVLPLHTGEPGDWTFLAIERVLRDAPTTDPSYHRLVRLLGSAESRMFRVWSQSRVLLLATSLAGIGGLAMVGAWLIRAAAPSHQFTLNGWSLLAAIVLAIALAFPRVREHAGRISIGILSLVLWIPAWLHVLMFDRLFLKLGRVRSSEIAMARGAAEK